MMEGTEHSCSAASCRQADDSQMVSCEKCGRWWHYACGKFDPSKFDTATPWFCGESTCEDTDEGEAKSLDAQLKDDERQPAPSGQGQLKTSMDILIEAAATAQATVAQRDSELAALRQEMEEMKVAMTKPSLETEKIGEVKMPRGPKPKVIDERLELIKKIQANHQALLVKIGQQSQSTPIRGKQERRASFQESSFRDGDMASLLTILNRSNVQELPSFSGDDRREWPYFEDVFKITTIEGKYSGKENVSRLRKALKGEAYHLVSDRLKYSSDAEAIMDSLRAIFGRSDVLVHDLTADLLNLPTLTSRWDPKLRLWAVKLNGFVADITSMKREDDLNNGYVLTCLVGKLGAGLYQEWVKKKAANPLVNFKDFAEFLTEKVIDLPPDLVKQAEAAAIKKLHNAPKSSGRVLTHQPVPAAACAKCSRKHPLTQCPEFKALTADQRLAFAKEKLMCFSCLELEKHNWKACGQRRTCGTGGCARRHHPLLHQTVARSSTALNTAAPPFNPQPHLHAAQVGTDLSIMFKVVPIRIHGKDNFVDTYAFLDDGSSLSMMEKDLFDQLGLDGDPEGLTLLWTGGVARHGDSMRTSLSVSGVNNRKRHLLKDVYTVKNLELPGQSLNVAELKKLYPHLRGLPLTDLVNAKPKLLVGLDQAKFLWGRGQRHGNDEEPCAIKTLLGWIVYGKTSPTVKFSSLQAAKPSMHLLFHDAIKYEDELHDLVKRHFTTEDFGVMAPKGDLVSRDVSRAMDIMQRTLRLDGTCYEIGLLWSSDVVKLPDSYPMALKRLIGLEKSLQKKPHLLKWKNNHLSELLSKGYARVASKEDLETEWPRVWYAPTFIVENPNKFPPKPRDVADVAAKVNGVSLNTFLLKGPDNLVPLHAGIFKFRERAVAVNADVKEMFHRIRIKREDQQCQRILWRNGDSSRSPTVYIMQVMMFGPRCSPTCAQFIKNQHAEQFREECPEAVDGLTKRTYVDDYFNSHDSVDKAIAVTRDAIRICKSMNFDLVGVQSNNREFLQQTPESHVNSKLVSIDPNDRESIVAKILGMYWHPLSDHFTYNLSKDEVLEKMLLPDAVVTKREMLRIVMKIFDPLGLVSLYVIRGRIVLQDVWREGLGWDEPLSQALRSCWLDFIKDLKNIEKLRIPRRYVSWKPDDSQVSLVVFVDASEKAFAAVAFLRFESMNQVEVALVMAKAKVAPVKKISVPRLELQAAVLGVRLATTVKNTHTIRIDDTFFLSDSSTVLSWINSSKFKFPSFVAVRVGEILDSTSPRQWYHVRSCDNVADDATKWSYTTTGDHQTRWFNGPEFLRAPISTWPVSPSKRADNLESCESLEPVKNFVHRQQQSVSYSIQNELKARFRARWSSSVRVIAFLLRFMDILRKRPVEKEPFVTPVEYCRAERWMFRKIQIEVFPIEVAALKAHGKVSSSSPILSLSPFLDEESTIRMSSRAQKAMISYASRNPAILPKSHALVSLFIEHFHENNLHMGTATTISDIRERAWVISIRSALERVKSRCYRCKLLKAKPVMPMMGQLPECRLAFNSRPFTHVGVDCFGPLLVRFGRGTVKRYGMIFTCLTFRAVQIELLNDLSLDQCTMALRRFIINRVVTRYLYSDNGLNFVGANNQLNKDIKEMETALSAHAAKFEGIQWRFIPAYSPWMGGAWERLIQAIKKSVEFVLKDLIPREDVLRNALIEAQGQINRRPLTHIPVDPEDPKPLTPNLMLFGEDERDVTAPGVFSERDLCSKLYSRRSQHLMSQLTRRWYLEYLPEITRRSKWYKNSKSVEVDNVVLLIDPNEIRSAWQLGRVVRVYPGPDGVVRTANIQVSNGSIKMKRAVGRLAILDLESSR